VVLLASCSSRPSVTNKTASSKKLPVISIIADSKQALALFQQQEKNIEKRVGVRLEFHYPSRLNDNLEDFLFASKKRYDIYVLFPAKIPQYVERNMLLPVDNYINLTKDMDDILPVYRNLYMKCQGQEAEKWRLVHV
jgi:multiple sugar transport system substrate-binding protein